MRDKKIDFLRFLGLSLIVLAHVNPPEFLFQIRNFDVPLMVILSGMSYTLSHKEGASYKSYLIKRFKRLVLPVWIFLTIYFLIVKIFNLPIEKISIKLIVTSYGLITGIGYLWIIRVFFLVAVLSPIAYKINLRIRSNILFIFYFFILLTVYDLVVFTGQKFENNTVYQIFSLFAYYAVSYTLIFALGIRIVNFSKKELWAIFLVSLIIFCSLAMIYKNLELNIYTRFYKYPPRLYYLSYSIFVSIILWILLKETFVNNAVIFCRPVWDFISQNTLWIYLWHIPMIKIFLFYYSIPFELLFFLVYGSAVLVYFIQYRVVKYIVDKKIKSEHVKRTIHQLFIG